MTENATKRCVPCQVATPRTEYKHINMTPLPEAPWRELSTDFYGPLPKGEYLLVIFDKYSRYPVVKIVNSTSASTVIPAIVNVMFTFSIPDALTSDNGPLFSSEQLNSYATHMRFKHRKVTPYWPQANGEVDRFMWNLDKVVEAASSEGNPWKQEFNKCLRNYRVTPHTAMNRSPSADFFGREIKMKLPAF